MADNPIEVPDEDGLLWNDQAALHIGGIVFAMVERLEPLSRITPGVRSNTRIEIDGKWFKLSLTSLGQS